VKTIARLLRTVLRKLRETLEFKDAVDIACLEVLLRTFTQVTVTYPSFVGGDAQLLKSPQKELLSLAKDSQRKGSLTANIHAFVQAAFSIRDFWSRDTWRSVDAIQRRWQFRVSHNDEISIEQLPSHLDDLITGVVAFIGLTSESMTRESAWLMLDSGRRLERALTLIALLRSTLASRHDDALQSQVLEAVLVSTDSLTIYQRRYRCYIQLPLVLELLLLDESHPRSLAYQLHQLSQHIGALPRPTGNRQLSEEERLILKAYTDLRLCNLFELTQVNENDGIYTNLDKVLSNMTAVLWRLADVIAQAYFSHSQTSQLIMRNVSSEDEL
jgi:uncharacterized alpha-E superfamily protein